MHDFRFLNRIARHPILRKDPNFVDFLELDGDLPKATNTSALSSAGVMRLFNRVGDSIGKMAYKMDETDQVSWRVFTRYIFIYFIKMILSRFSYYNLLTEKIFFYKWFYFCFSVVWEEDPGDRIPRCSDWKNCILVSKRSLPTEEVLDSFIC